MDLENTDPELNKAMAATGARLLIRRIFIVLGIAFVASLIMTWWENRNSEAEPS